MRKFLTQKFWSLGTSLGSLGLGSQKGPPEIFSNVVFLHYWDPNEAPDKVSYPSLSKKLVALRKRCEYTLKHDRVTSYINFKKTCISRTFSGLYASLQ